MRLIDELIAHPLFEERPAKAVLEPLGFSIHAVFQEVPDEDEEPEDAERFRADPVGFMSQVLFEVPEGFAELARFDTEDCEIVLLAVKPTTPLAHALMAPAEPEAP
ncbi:MAG: hypothetical protein GYB54_02595 [Gammaproteobacteria bacterium]|nr:hypothetical protein [Gammaproteobacteria bacterium]